MNFDQDLNKKIDRSGRREFGSVVWYLFYVGSSSENGGDCGSTAARGCWQSQRLERERQSVSL